MAILTLIPHMLYLFIFPPIPIIDRTFLASTIQHSLSFPHLSSSSLENPNTSIHFNVKYVNSYTLHLSQWIPPFILFSSFKIIDAKYDLHPKVMLEAFWDPYSHTNHHKKLIHSRSSFPMNCWVDDKCKDMHRHIWFVLAHDPPSSLSIWWDYHCFLHKNVVL